MPDPILIQSEADLDAATAEIDALIDLDDLTAEQDMRLDALSDAVVAYEDAHRPPEDAVIGAWMDERFADDWPNAETTPVTRRNHARLVAMLDVADTVPAETRRQVAERYKSLIEDDTQ